MMSRRSLCVVLVILGLALNAAAGNPGTVKWSTFISGSVPNGIAIGDDGTAYATSSYYGYLGAVDASGTRIWQRRLNNSYWESVSAPSIAADGTLYVHTDEVDALWAISPDGTVKWNIPFPSRSGSSPSIGADGTLYIFRGTGLDQVLYALRPDGSTKWSFPMAGVGIAAPSIGPDGLLYVSCDADWPSEGDSLVYAIDQDGQEVWSVPIPGQISTAPSIGAGGTMYVAMRNGVVQVVEGNGELGWQYAAGGAIYAGVAIAEDGGLFFGAHDGKLYALNADGSERWTYQAGGSIVGTPALGDDGSVYFSSSDQYVHAVGADGSFLWKIYVTYWRLTNTLIGPNGDVYVVGENGYYHPHVYAINSATGEVAQAPWPVHRQNSRGTFRRRPIDMPPIELQLGEPHVGILPAGEVHHFTVDTEVDRNLLIEVIPGEGIDRLAVDAGVEQVGHPGGGDYSTTETTVAGSYELLISPTIEGSYAITVLGMRIANSGGSYTVTARLADTHLSDLTPRGGGNIGEVSVNVDGLGFVAGTQVQLEGAGLPLLTADEVIVLSGTELTARFDLGGAPPGLYDLVVTWPDASSLSLEEAFTVIPGTGPRLGAVFTGPEAVRPGRQYVAWVEYGNDGDTDMRAPLLFVTSPQNVKMRLSGDEPFSTSGVQILGVGSDHPAGVLRPGEHHRVPIYFEAALVPTIRFEVERLRADGTAIDWQEVEDEIRPADMSDELWAASWMNFRSTIGSTWRDYEKALADTATYLARYGNATYDASELFGVLFQRSMSGSMGEVHAFGLDAFAGARGVPLFFSRVAYGGLYQRFTPGPLGRGWSHAFEYRATRTAADRVVVSGPGGSKRSFFVGAGGGWRGMPGDFCRLEEIGGGALSLTEKSGLAMYFDASGRLDGIDEPNGNGLTMAYDGSRLESVTHTNGQFLTLEYNADDRIQYLTDHAGRFTEYVYDPSGELLEQVIAPGGVTTDYAYRPPSGGAGDYALVSVTHPDGTHTYYDHDSRGRMSSQWLDGGEERLDYGYDIFGTVEESDALDHVVTARFGSSGELLEIENHLSEKLSLDYDAQLNLTRLILPDGSRYRFDHDPRGNPIEASTPKDSVFRAGYTKNPTRLEWFLDAREQPMTFEYENGNPTRVEYPDGSYEEFAYDGVDGDLEIFTNRRQDPISLIHNDLGELTGIDWSDGTWFDFAHDEVEREWTSSDESGTTTFDFDDRGILNLFEMQDGRWNQYTSNDAARRQRLETNDGFVLVYLYDDAGRLEALQDSSGFEIIRYHYDAAGRLEREDRGNDTSTVYSWDEADRLLSVAHYAPDDSVQAFFSYTYDTVGNPESMTTVGGTTTYAYDADGQLESVTYPGGRVVSYVYDPSGNREEVTDDGVPVNYDVNSLNQYTDVGGTIFTYDDDGNLETRTGVDGTATFEWDPENRLRSIVNPTGGTWNFIYDPLGNRVAVEHDGATRHFVLDPRGYGDVIAEYDGAGQLTARYIHGLGLVARLDGGGGLAFYGFDATGSTRLLTDGFGGVANVYDYSPFGVPLSMTETVPNPFRYVGRFGVMDDGHGTLFMRARYYDPTTGHFLSPDPIGLLGGFNLYSYVFNSPVKFADPSGLGALQRLRDAKQNKINRLARINLDDPEGSLNAYNDATKEFGHAATDLGVRTATTYVISLGTAPMQEPLPVIYHGIQALLGASDAIDAYAPNPYAQPGSGLPPPQAGSGSDWVTGDSSNVIYPVDPNEKVGPEGIGPDHFVLAGQKLDYNVYFENLPSATAPAQEVFVNDCLDRNLDWTTFRIHEVAFGDVVVSNSNQNAIFSTRVGIPDFRPGEDKEWWVDVETGINLATGCFSLTLRQLDPETGELPMDVYAGFLPPEDGTGRGQGHVVYSVSSKADLADGRLIRNRASIVFGLNDPIWTNEVINTIGQPQFRLTVSITGDGSGSVASTPEGIDCGDVCEWLYSDGTEVELNHFAEDGSQFSAWGGDADCLDGMVTMNADVACIATFVTVANEPPVADAGPDQFLEADAQCEAVATLDGSASYDPDEDPLTFLWRSAFSEGNAAVFETTVPIGDHEFTLMVTDDSDESASDTTMVTVEDVTGPTITLSGEVDLTLECKQPYADPGATVEDNCEGELEVVVGGDTVSTETPADFIVTYDATDSVGNSAEQLTRTVSVVDTEGPAIILNGDADMTLECKQPYTEPGATAEDTCEGEVDVVIGGDTVNSDAPAVFNITYDAADSLGNAAEQATRSVSVLDSQGPNIECGLYELFRFRGRKPGAMYFARFNANDSCSEVASSQASVSCGEASVPVNRAQFIAYLPHERCRIDSFWGIVMVMGPFMEFSATATDSEGNTNSCSAVATDAGW